MTTKGKFLIGVVLIVGAVGYLMYTGIRETSTYYLTIEEFLPQKEALANEGVRVAGRVGLGSVNWNPKDLNLHFTMVAFPGVGKGQNGQDDKNSQDGKQPVRQKQTEHGQLEGLAVHYQGILPDMFAEDRDVIVEGHYTPGANGNILEATTVMTSCPSKYEAEIEQEGQEGQEKKEGKVAASAY